MREFFLKVALELHLKYFLELCPAVAALTVGYPSDFIFMILIVNKNGT
jgi:hypothetical protein